MLDFEGRPVPVEPRDTIASALFRAGVRVFSRSFRFRRARGLYCMTGDCANCLVTVDGEPCVQACMTPAAAQVVTAGSSFAFDPGVGFAGLNTPAGFLKVNRALKARVDVYMRNWASALTALGESFIDANGALNFGAYPVGGGLAPLAADYNGDLLAEILYNRRYSLLWEGAHRWIDMRRYNKLAELPKYAANHVIFRYAPLPDAECLARTDAVPAGCSIPSTL